MNYRHAFHAGNHADVLKHAALAAVLARLAAKPKPLIAIDAFAGAGRTDLKLDERPDRTGEWRRGVARLPLDPAAAPEALAPYLAALARANPQGGLRFYPGSPLIALGLLRPEDRLLAVEAHPEEHAALAQLLRAAPEARALQEDGWGVTKAALPPTPRRGLLLLDPPFEQPDEEAMMLDALEAGLRRWPVGVYMLWRPVKTDPRPFERRVVRIAGERPTLACELRVDSPQASGLTSSALTLVNPPFGLECALGEIGAFLAERLGVAGRAAWRLDTLIARR